MPSLLGGTVGPQGGSIPIQVPAGFTRRSPRHRRLAALVALCLVAFVTSAREPVATSGTIVPLAASAEDQQIAGVVARMLKQFHYSKHPLDNDISSRWLDHYLANLDPERSVFLQSDVDEFEVWRKRLDDDVASRPPSMTAAFVVYQRFRERMTSRIEDLRARLAGPLDLRNQETFVRDRGKAGLGWPASTDEADAWWSKKLQDMVIEEWLDADTGIDSGADVIAIDRVTKRYDQIEKQLGEAESVDVLEMWLMAFGQAFDPESRWFKPIGTSGSSHDASGSVDDIGVQLGSEHGYTVIERVTNGSAADLSGRLEERDRIVAVAEGEQDFVDVVGMRLEKVVELLRGPKGTDVRLKILPAAGAPGEIEVVSLMRGRLFARATTGIRDVSGHRLGVIGLPNFFIMPDDSQTGRRPTMVVADLLRELDEQGAEGVVFDVRGNGGGALVEAIDMAGLFLPGGPVVQVRSRDGDIAALRDKNPGVAWSGHVVVLVDAKSAAGSEIVAGALQDYGRAVIVGAVRTSGSGMVQQLVDLQPYLSGPAPAGPWGGKMKITTQKLYRVSGGSIESLGVAADVVVPTSCATLEIDGADLGDALTPDEIAHAPFVRIGDPSAFFPELRARSETRVSASDEFGRLERAITESKRLDHQREVSLVLEERRTERRSLCNVVYKNDRNQGGRSERDTNDFVLDEAFAVLFDYVLASAH